MFFFLEYDYTLVSGTPKWRQIKDGETPGWETGTLFLSPGRQRLEVFGQEEGVFLIMGDPVFRSKEEFAALPFIASGKMQEAVLYEQVAGHYYWFFLHSGGMECGSSFGAVFPVCYHVGGQRVVVASSSFFLAERIGVALTPDRRNLLERLLFNYPFFQSTWWEEIKLLEAQRRLHISKEGAKVAGDFELNRYFGHPAKASRTSLEQLAGLFQEEAALFFPTVPFGISFTGGFDGRTLAAAAKKAERKFVTYSFGRAGASDVALPAAQAARLQMPYQPILLDETYLEEHALESAFSFMQMTDYNGNFGRPHYHYAAQRLAKEVDYIVTGNFGSELFRALHQPGPMMSRELIGIFAAEDNSWKDALAAATSRWGMTGFDTELDALIADLEVYRGKMAGWERNHQFYYFVFNEIFRKYFGPELIMQSRFLNNRTPFLNFRFFCALNETAWAGVHSRLFEKVKAKRMKGQMFYACFIRQAWPALYRLDTNKGYSPADVLEPLRLPLLAGKLMRKKLFRQAETDENRVEVFFERCKGAISMRTSNGPGMEMPGSFAGMQPEQMIKYYSIAAGWRAAHAVTSVQVVPSGS